MEQYFLSFILRSITISLIILLVLILNLLFGKAFSARLRYTVWLILLVGLILPMPALIRNGIIPLPLPVPAQTQYSASEFSVSGRGPEIMPAAANTNASPAWFSRQPFSPLMVCVFVWSIIALAVFFYHIRRYIRFLQTVRRWGVTVKDEKILSIFRSVLEEKGLGSKNIDLLSCGFVSSSILTGFRRPMILLPERSFETDELEFIFRHELIHYKRRDLFVKLLFVMVISIYWFNPLVYWLCELMQADGEMSCDEAVLLGSDVENRHFYADVIIGMIEKKNALGTMLSTCFFHKGKLSIKKRLDSIVDTTRKMNWPAIPIISVIIALTLFSGSVFAVQELPTTEQAIAITELPATALSLNEIIEIALEKSGGGVIEGIYVEPENGRFFYEVIVRIDEKTYEIEIDSETGEITEFSEIIPLAELVKIAQVSFERAMEIAVVRTGGGTVEEIELEYDYDLLVYEVIVRNNNRRYEITINAIKEEIIGVESL